MRDKFFYKNFTNAKDKLMQIGYMITIEEKIPFKELDKNQLLNLGRDRIITDIKNRISEVEGFKSIEMNISSKYIIINFNNTATTRIKRYVRISKKFNYSITDNFDGDGFYIHNYKFEKPNYTDNLFYNDILSLWQFILDVLSSR